MVLDSRRIMLPAVDSLLYTNIQNKAGVLVFYYGVL